MPITALPTPPTRQDPASFAERADAFLAALPTFQSEANALAVAVNADEATASSAASTATTQAGTATTQAGIATTQAGIANTARIAAELAETNAEAAQAAAELALDQFTDQYLGPKATDPTLDNDGNALAEGSFYWNTATKEIRFYNGTLWVTPNLSGTSYVALTGDQTVAGTKTFSSPITGSISGNAGTVTNGVYTTGDQTVGGVKTFSSGPVLNNAVNLGAKDSGGTARFLIGIGGDNLVNIWNAGNGVVRILNQAGSAMLVQLSDTAGNFTATGNVTAYSDERLKRNWSGLPTDFIERLAAVKHGTYERIDSGERQVGVSAQALRELMPEAVLENEEGTLSVAYGNAALTAAVKLAERVVALEARLAALEGR